MHDGHATKHPLQSRPTILVSSDLRLTASLIEKKKVLTDSKRRMIQRQRWRGLAYSPGSVKSTGESISNESTPSPLPKSCSCYVIELCSPLANISSLKMCSNSGHGSLRRQWRSPNALRQRKIGDRDKAQQHQQRHSNAIGQEIHGLSVHLS